MAYKDISRCGAIICTHVTIGKKAILGAVRDKPIRPEDSGWQFTCGQEGHNAEEAKLWMLSEVVSLDPTIIEIADSEVGVAFERSTVKEPWDSVYYG